MVEELRQVLTPTSVLNYAGSINSIGDLRSYDGQELEGEQILRLSKYGCLYSSIFAGKNA